VDLIVWCIDQMRPKPETILDPFAGSFTTAIACIRMGKKFVGIEREPTYFDAGVERVKAELSRTSLLEPAPKIIQRTLLD
jgi:site-specific DNA-methyltransferase (adenine-specific)